MQVLSNWELVNTKEFPIIRKVITKENIENEVDGFLIKSCLTLEGDYEYCVFDENKRLVLKIVLHGVHFVIKELNLTLDNVHFINLFLQCFRKCKHNKIMNGRIMVAKPDTMVRLFNENDLKLEKIV